MRFRWYQGFIPDNDFAPEWAIDNVFIGMACMDHCLGHGVCTDTMMCSCDTGYRGDSCVPANDKPLYLRDDFTATDFVLPSHSDGRLSVGKCKVPVPHRTLMVKLRPSFRTGTSCLNILLYIIVLSSKLFIQNFYISIIKVSLIEKGKFDMYMVYRCSQGAT